MDVKVDIYADKMVLTGNGRTVTVQPANPYSSQRLLVGTFTPAVDCVKNGLKQLGAIGFWQAKPRLTIIAKDRIEGGLSEIELRCLLEVGYSAGAKQVEVLVDGVN